MEQLAWLPAHADLAAAISAAKRIDNPADRLSQAMHLAGFRHDFTAIGRLDKLAADGLAEAAASSRPMAAGLAACRLAILSSHTVDHLVPAIRVAGLRRGLAVSVHAAPYGLYRQALLGEDPMMAAFAPQLVLLALDARDAPLDLPLESSEAAVTEAVTARVDELRHLWRQARARFNAQVMQQTLVPADPPLFGSFEALVPAAPNTVIGMLNAAIRVAAREEGVLLLDLALPAASYGQVMGLADPVRWHQAKQLVSPVLAPLYGDLVARVAAAVMGRSRKCLVLDLDNTLWGGVIGDDGIDGIKLGQGDATGEAFIAFQRYVALLGKRGIILAVCSKNDAAVAEAVFTQHPEMALRRGDIATFVANWNDKAGNLRQIAKTLNIGLDSLVFVDDNPAERDIIRRELPEVAVPELPEDVANYPARLAAAGYFEATGFTADDAARSRSYALNEARRVAQEQATDMDGYLRSLKMVLTATDVGPGELSRVTQLINKTNQFNLTTRRYTEAEVQALAANPAAVALALRLTDRFGDNGLICVVLARPDAALRSGELLIDTWLMSCRVLGRQVEAAVLEVLAAAASRRGVSTLIGEYRPTGRNGMVAEHYPNLGFVPLDPLPDSPEGTTCWQYDVIGGRAPKHFIELDAR
ncbi:methoxymalonyl-ACP biosynthesis protein FkbH [Siccirubricoccus deserti]|uniref:HAD-IIIC family phosphatase n=1 Tax=Siccirubricoccus deserti TaxID=2013562 RepID=A0A9X0UG93_9PROT|nr:HAD-IIIC family phosphatase [Siccirubricoccus deserti]MBC4018688.1 HAD-IIIC family phosphatase [Siccirubricoccus deserti]GGC67744.1 methoxymalonyl-ACP biosynthesis protein FkbH [Siccirubricoccus deserti]